MMKCSLTGAVKDFNAENHNRDSDKLLRTGSIEVRVGLPEDELTLEFGKRISNDHIKFLHGLPRIVYENDREKESNFIFLEDVYFSSGIPLMSKGNIERAITGALKGIPKNMK